MRRPNFVHIKTKNEPAYKPVIDVSSHHFKPMGTEFKITRRNPTNLRMETADPTPETLLDHWWPLTVILDLQKSSNVYREQRKEMYPDLHCWKRNYSEPFGVSCIYYFIAMVYYMGVVRLPCKRDYWSSHPCMPHHPITDHLTRDRFSFLWRHIHVYDDEDIDVEEEEVDKENTEEDDDLHEYEVERVNSDEEDDSSNAENFDTVVSLKKAHQVKINKYGISN